MATWDQSLNTTHISNNLRKYEAARSGFFVFSVDVNQLTNLYHPDYTGEHDAAGSSDKYSAVDVEEALRLNVTKAFIPGFSVSTESYRRGNDVVKFATIPEFKDGSIVIDDVVGLDTKSLLYSWLYLAYNPNTRKGGRMADYKKTCTLMEYTQDYELIRTWTLEGCFVTELSEDDFDRENDGKRQITATISYDRALMNDIVANH